MLFIPEKKAKETQKRLLKEGRERRKRKTLERRKDYLIAKENNDLDSFYEKYQINYKKNKISSGD
jgi:hypothetical protein